jgi:hypothetical protein
VVTVNANCAGNYWVTYCVEGDTAAAITTAITATGTLSWYSDAAGTVSIMTLQFLLVLQMDLQHTCNSNKRKYECWRL